MQLSFDSSLPILKHIKNFQLLLKIRDLACKLGLSIRNISDKVCVHNQAARLFSVTYMCAS